MEALGVIDSIDRALELVHVVKTLEPEPQAAAIYAELLPLFADLYDDLTPAFETLARLHDHHPGPACSRG